MPSDKKLYRSINNKMIGGVAAGVGAYAGVDPIIIRFFFFTLLIAGGLAIPVYGLLWYLLPVDPAQVAVIEEPGATHTSFR